jgi:hypothetical protein
MRYYGKYSQLQEEKSRCVVLLYDNALIGYSHQCRNKRGKGPDGLYCGTHANKLAKGRNVYVPENVE